jgi:hypothetical protein
VLARRAILIALFAYVLLDLGCPLLPGAFSFDPAESVDAVTALRVRPPALPRLASPLPTVTSTPLLTQTAAHAAEAPTIGPPAERRRDARRDQRRASDSRSSIEDD